MSKQIISLLRNILKLIYNFIISYKSYSYNLKKNLNYNENLLNLLGFDVDEIKSKIILLNFDYNDEKLSWHYHLFTGLKQYFKDKKIYIT